MQRKSVVGVLGVGMLALGLTVGCESSDVPVAEAPAPKPVESKPLPKEVTKGGGTSSSGNMGRNPGADPLKH